MIWAAFQAAIDAGAEDFESADHAFMITTDPHELFAVKEKLDAAGIVSTEAEIEWIPNTAITCDEETAKSNHALIEWLEEIDDVDTVYHNMEV